MIESYHWKQDLLALAKKLKPLKKPPRFSEKLQVNFEKEVIISFFMIRKLLESNKFSEAITELKIDIYCSPCVGAVNNRNFSDINDLYDLEHEEKIQMKVNFLCNQLIHGGAIFAYREKDRNWGGIYTCSDFKREKYIYKIKLSEIISILEIAGNDYPTRVSMEASEDASGYIIGTN